MAQSVSAVRSAPSRQPPRAAEKKPTPTESAKAAPAATFDFTTIPIQSSSPAPAAPSALWCRWTVKELTDHLYKTKDWAKVLGINPLFSPYTALVLAPTPSVHDRSDLLANVIAFTKFKFCRSACANMQVAELGAVLSNQDNESKLLIYFQTLDSAALSGLNSAAVAVVCADTFKRLQKFVDEDHWSAVLPAAALMALHAHGAVDLFVKYVESCRPILDTEKGADIQSFIELNKDRGDPTAWKNKIKYVRNYHRFTGEVLFILSENLLYFDKDRPINLIVHTGKDWNSYFHRDKALESMFRVGDFITYLIEGRESLGQIAREAKEIAVRYGRSGYVDNLFISGHGSPRSVEMAAVTLPRAEKPAPKDAAARLDLDLDENLKQADKLFDTLLGLFDRGSAEHRVIFNACSSGAGVFDPKRGKYSRNPEDARRQLVRELHRHPNLVEHIEQRAKALGRDVQVIGGRTVVGGRRDYVDDRHQPTLFSYGDPAVTGSALDYVRDGNDPEGVLRSVLIGWAQSPTATRAAVAARNQRPRSAATSWAAWVIHTALSMLFPVGRSAEQGLDIALVKVLIAQVDNLLKLNQLSPEDTKAVANEIFETKLKEQNYAFTALLTGWPAWKSSDKLLIETILYSQGFRHYPTYRAILMLTLAKFTSCQPLVGYVINYPLSREALLFPASRYKDTSAQGELLLALLYARDAILNEYTGFARSAPGRFLASFLPPGATRFPPFIEKMLDGFAETPAKLLALVRF